MGSGRPCRGAAGGEHDEGRRETKRLHDGELQQRYFGNMIGDKFVHGRWLDCAERRRRSPARPGMYACNAPVTVDATRVTTASLSRRQAQRLEYFEARFSILAHFISCKEGARSAYFTRSSKRSSLIPAGSRWAVTSADWNSRSTALSALSPIAWPSSTVSDPSTST
jgi:hypothetical protein